MENKKLNNIENTCQKFKIGAIICSILFVLGIVFFITLIDSFFVGGLICMLIGFYGSPILWGLFIYYSFLKRVLYTIKDNKVTDISSLAKIFNKPERFMRRIIGFLISHRYIESMDLIKVTSEPNAPKQKLSSNKCDSCGAPLKRVKDEFMCKYCGTHFRLE